METKPMKRPIEAMWTRNMMGSEIDVQRFVQELLEMLSTASAVAGRVHDEGHNELSVGSDSLLLATEAAPAKFRMICARLAVIFSTASDSPSLLYGGHLSSQLRIGESTVSAALEFKNVATDGRFRVHRVA